MADIATQQDIAYLVYLVRTNPIIPGHTHHNPSGRIQYFLDFNSVNWGALPLHPQQAKLAAELAEKKICALARIDFQVAGSILSMHINSPQRLSIVEFSKILRNTVRTNAEAVHANNPGNDLWCWDQAEEHTAKLIRPNAREYIESLLSKLIPSAIPA